MKKRLCLSAGIIIFILGISFTSVSCLKEMPVPEFDGPSIPFDMVLIPGGTFYRGSSKVTVSSFKMSRTEVTQYEWKKFSESNPSSIIGDNLPVEQVLWFEAVSFCNRKSLAEGKTPCYSIAGEYVLNWWAGLIEMKKTGGYRLPTEAEWEYAAGGGSAQTMYAGTNDSAALPNYAWFVNNSNDIAHSVGKKLPNSFGLYDMSGNVLEWCWDYYGDYPTSAQQDPTGPENTTGLKVIRGGWFGNTEDLCRTNARRGINYYNRYSFIGFRLAQDIP